MNTRDLLEEAKRRYPIGSRVVCLCDKQEYVVGDFDHAGSGDGDVWCNSTDGWGVKLCGDGAWTDIVGYTNKDVSILKQLQPKFVEFKRWCDMFEEDRPFFVTKTTEELFLLWLGEQTKTTTNKYRGIQKEAIDFDGGELAKEHWKQTKK